MFQFQVTLQIHQRKQKFLQAKDYVTYESRLIRLTKKGRILAEEIYERHCELTKLLISLGVDSATAEQDACRIEHCISQETFNAVKRYNGGQINYAESKRAEN